jgi:hypothetical protein
MKFQSSYIAIFFLLCFVFSCTKNETNEIVNPNPNNFKLRLTGQIRTCNGTGMSNGYLLVASNQGISSLYITNGTFDTTFEASNSFDSIMVFAIDFDSLKTSDTLFMPVNSDSMNLGIINSCAWNVDEYINFKIDNEKYVFIPAFYDSLEISAWDTLSAPTTYLYRTDIGNLIFNSKYRRTQFTGITTGLYNIGWNSSLFIGRYYSFNMPASGSINYTYYGNIGDYITGTLNVPFIDNTDSLNYVLTGSFKVRRDR